MSATCTAAHNTTQRNVTFDHFAIAFQPHPSIKDLLDSFHKAHNSLVLCLLTSRTHSNASCYQTRFSGPKHAAHEPAAWQLLATLLVQLVVVAPEALSCGTAACRR
jgi:hypothetical protein